MQKCQIHLPSFKLSLALQYNTQNLINILLCFFSRGFGNKSRMHAFQNLQTLLVVYNSHVSHKICNLYKSKNIFCKDCYLKSRNINFSEGNLHIYFRIQSCLFIQATAVISFFLFVRIIFIHLLNSMQNIGFEHFEGSKLILTKSNFGAK